MKENNFASFFIVAASVIIVLAGLKISSPIVVPFIYKTYIKV